MAEPVKQKEWLIIFLVYNNNYYDKDHQDNKDNDIGRDNHTRRRREYVKLGYYSMEAQTKYILNQIRYTHYSQQVKTIFVEAEIKNDENIPVATLSMLRKKPGTWLSAVNRVWRDSTTVEVMTDAISLEDILKKLTSYYPANKHMIITAGHGSILGINYYIPELKQKVKPNPEIDAIVSHGLVDTRLHEKQLNNIDPASEEFKKLLYLANAEIAKVLKKVFTKKKLDVLVMYNCVMQNLFTQFELKDIVDWLVAPMSGISIPGFNYGKILNEISVNPGMDAEKVSMLFTNTIRDGNHYSYHKDDIERSWNVTAIKLDPEYYKSMRDPFDKLFTSINELSKARNGKYLIFCMWETVRHTFSYSYYCLQAVDMPDLGVFLELFKENIIKRYPPFAAALVPLIDDLQNVLNNPPRHHDFEGKSFYENDFYYVQKEKKYKDKIVNSGIMLPIRPLTSTLLGYVCDLSKYPAGENGISDIPTFLKSSNYGEVIKKLMMIPWQ